MLQVQKLQRAALFFILFSLSIPAASARDMQGRLGIGYNSEFSNITATNAVPGISLKYGFTRDMALEGVLGLSTSTPANSVTAVKFFKNLFFETNLNFYFMAGAGIIRADNETGTELISGLGAEFFIPGIESLGFSMETGGSLGNSSGSFVLKTLGVSFLNAGIHFYF